MFKRTFLILSVLLVCGIGIRAQDSTARIWQGVYTAAMKRQTPWAQSLGQGMTAQQIAAAAIILRTLRQRLEHDEPNKGE